MKDDENLSNFIMVAEILLRVSALENLLLKKGIVTQQELLSSIKETSMEAAKNVLRKANVTGDLEKIIQDFQNKKINSN